MGISEVVHSCGNTVCEAVGMHLNAHRSKEDPFVCWTALWVLNGCFWGVGMDTDGPILAKTLAAHVLCMTWNISMVMWEPSMFCIAVYGTLLL